ncbi:hypothetical protein ScPMuIL_015848 [Solemya velum]
MGLATNRRLRFLSKPYVGPVIVGLLLGITLNIIAAPFVGDTCHNVIPNNGDGENLVKLRETKSVEDAQMKAPNDQDEKMEKTLIFEQAPPPNNQFKVKPKKLFRPRYVSTELGIKEKLFVAAITSPATIDTFGVALNKTVSSHVTQLVFFTQSPPTNPPPGLTLVLIKNQAPSEMPIYILKYIVETYADVFDFFMIITDRTHLRAEKVFDFVSHISVSENIHMGSPEVNTKYCNIEGSVILSQSVMQSISTELDWCLKNPHPTSPSMTLGICVEHASGLPCQDTGGGKTYPYFHVEDFDYDDDIDALRGNPKFNTSIAVYPMPDDIAHYKVHRYFCLLELNQTRQEIDRTKKNIMKMSKMAPAGTSDMSWPLGTPETLHGLSRFDLIRWAYFTETHIYFEDDFTNIRPLIGVHKQDVEAILELAIGNIEKKYTQFQFHSLLNGYRRFDPTRGMEYILDLKLVGKEDVSSRVETRVHLLRPLGKVEILPVPYVTEHRRIDLILPVAADDLKGFATFLEAYRKTCLTNHDNTHLRILFIYKNRTDGDKTDQFALPKSLIDYYQNKHINQTGKISWQAFEFHEPYVSDFVLMDLLTRNYKQSSLLLIGSVGMELTIDFLNRVRMNTIINWQVFFPISFWQFKPNLVYQKFPYPSQVELGAKYGFFNKHSFQHCSFYVSDYLEARKRLSPYDAMQSDLFHMFLRYEKLNVFRAAEPSLRHKWKDVVCDPLAPETVYHNCLAHNSEGLASRSQLATLLFEQTMGSQEHH